jgi:hypothetical protein
VAVAVEAGEGALDRAVAFQSRIAHLILGFPRAPVAAMLAQCDGALVRNRPRGHQQQISPAALFFARKPPM